MSNEEKRDIEDKINDAMAKIVSDTAGDAQPEKKSDASASQSQPGLRSQQDLPSRQDRRRSHMCRLMSLNLPQSFSPKKRSIRR